MYNNVNVSAIYHNFVDMNRVTMYFLLFWGDSDHLLSWPSHGANHKFNNIKEPIGLEEMNIESYHKATEL